MPLRLLTHQIMQIGISSMDINAVVEAVRKRLSLLPNLKSTVESLNNEIAQKVMVLQSLTLRWEQFI